MGKYVVEWKGILEKVDVLAASVGGNGLLLSPSKIGEVEAEGITMTSILFCKHGGIITPVTSGQVPEIIFSEFEEELYIKFYDVIRFENWSDDKKECAEAIWNKFYVEYGYDAAFVAGLIGNMYKEGEFGKLEGGEWPSQELKGNMIITTLAQAKIACIDTGSGYGIGAIQWSTPDRKLILYNNYEKLAVDGMLSAEQLREAELQTIFDEFNGRFKNSVINTYNEYSADTTGDYITYATKIIFRNYEIPNTYTQVDKENGYIIPDSVTNRAGDADKFDNLPAIYQRILAVKAAYEAFK